MIKITVLSIFLFFFLKTFSQVDSLTIKPKDGFSFGAVPVIGYNTDKGFQYGIAMSVFDFADGSYYPNYKNSLYFELSRTTKKNGINQVMFDCKDIFSTKLRMLAEVSYITDKLLPFYGFNGYEVGYNSNFETSGKEDYISRAYYKIERNLTRITCDIQSAMLFPHTRCVGGWGYMNFKINTVDIKSINKDLPTYEKLPEVPTLYDEYVNNGIIAQDEKNGGSMQFLKTGLIYDTRDNEANPAKGSWSEIVFVGAPSLMNKDHRYVDLVLVHRHYFPLIKSKLTLANRIGYQGKIAGSKPFFMLPFHFNSYRIVEAFGGVKTIRGIMASRLVGDGIIFGNFEFRYKFHSSRIWNQDFYISANTFLDWGMVVQKHHLGNTPEIEGHERPHFSSGAGLRFAFNQNFIIAVDYGKAFEAADGNQAVYIALDFLY